MNPVRRIMIASLALSLSSAILCAGCDSGTPGSPTPVTSGFTATLPTVAVSSPGIPAPLATGAASPTLPEPVGTSTGGAGKIPAASASPSATP